MEEGKDDAILKTIAFVIHQVAHQNEFHYVGQSNESDSSFLSQFYDEYYPVTSYFRFLKELQRTTGCKTHHFICSMIVLEQFAVQITTHTVIRLFSICTLYVLKQMKDTSLLDEVKWANVGGMNAAMVSKLRDTFAKNISFNFPISQDLYLKYEFMLKQKASLVSFRSE